MVKYSSFNNYHLRHFPLGLWKFYRENNFLPRIRMRLSVARAEKCFKGIIKTMKYQNRKLQHNQIDLRRVLFIDYYWLLCAIY